MQQLAKLEPVQTFQVTADEAETRLDKFLCAKLDLTRREALRVLGQDVVTVNRKPVSEKAKGVLLEHSAVITVAAFEHPATATVLPEPDAPLVTLAAGEGFVVVDKPAGVPVMPLELGEQGTVLNAVVARYPQVQGIGEGGLRSGIVHRLDGDTSGALVVATEQERWSELRRAFKNHHTHKTYRAIVTGHLAGQGHEVMYLSVAQHKPAKVAVVEEQSGARRCSLEWRAVESLDGATLLEVDLGTGFLHQIRVMFAHLGHPVLGDTTYGKGDDEIPRQMLHAARLEVANIKAESPDPPDFSGVLESLRSG